MQAIVKVGPKGQVLIPKVFRDAYGIRPMGSIIIEDEKDGLRIRKQKFDAVAVFREIARSGKSVKKYDKSSYDKYIVDRFEKLRQ